MDTTAMGSPDANLSQSAEDRRSDTGDNGGKRGLTKIASFLQSFMGVLNNLEFM